MRTYHRKIICLSLLILSVSCQDQPTEINSKQTSSSDKIWHYSILDAMRRGIYEGTNTVKELKAHGDFGLGTFNHLNGELVALDGVIYRIPPSGEVEVAPDTMISPFTSLSFFNADTTMTFPFTGDFEDLKRNIEGILPSRNVPYAIKVRSQWSEITVGGAKPVETTDTTELAVLMKSRPQYQAENIQGMMIGFFTPSLMSNVDLSPFHFHFLSEDKKFAGHLIKGSILNAELHIQIDSKDGYEIELLNQNRRYRNLNFKTTKEAANY
ncbi:acetolactate decarboxylase [Echinicola sp. 20G]|uniref:acetolactate decarboxylase n=1 Tax=Echinicola sp. 20G TaxID=2781961 RepID=UPI0019105B02|nr:acetolactate decarboxylase [Echinicola sp. 20G]